MAGAVELEQRFAVFDVAAARVEYDAVLAPLQEQNRIGNGAAGRQHADRVQRIAAATRAFVVDHDDRDAMLARDALKLLDRVIDLSALSSLQASKTIKGVDDDGGRI